MLTEPGAGSSGEVNGAVKALPICQPHEQDSVTVRVDALNSARSWKLYSVCVCVLSLIHI